jgi:hypothetical protein
VWGTEGSVWACWWVEPFGYPHRSVADASEVHARTMAALLALPSEWLVASVCRPVPAAELERRMRFGVDPTGAPGWVVEARRAATRDGPWFERRWLLAARLADPAGRRNLLAGLLNAASGLDGAFGLPNLPPTAGEAGGRVAAAAQLEAQVGQHLRLSRAGAGQLRWLFARAALRGLVEEPMPAGGDGGQSSSVSVVRLDRDAVYWEGGRGDDPGRPSHRRYLTVEHPDHGVGYQTFACLGDMPRSWSFPYGSGEWLWHLDDQLPFPVDWAVRAEAVDNHAARARSNRARRNLSGSLHHLGPTRRDHRRPCKLPQRRPTTTENDSRPTRRCLLCGRPRSSPSPTGISRSWSGGR